jgi:hypothetical protein
MTWQLRKALFPSIREAGESSYSEVWLSLRPISVCHCRPAVLSLCFNAIGATTNQLISACEKLLGSCRVTNVQLWLPSMPCSLQASLSRLATPFWTPSELREEAGQELGALPGYLSKVSSPQTNGNGAKPVYPMQHKSNLWCTQCSANYVVYDLWCTQCSANMGLQELTAAPYTAYLHIPPTTLTTPALQNSTRPHLAQAREAQA